MAPTKRKLMLYDPRTNVSTDTSYDFLEELTGMRRGNLSSLKSKRLKIRNIGCYLIDHKTTVKERKEMYAREKYPDEAWVSVEGSSGTYLVSNYARFQRVHKTCKSFIMPYLHKGSGNLRVKVSFKGEYKQYEVAHLVAQHFIGQREKGKSVRRKNGIKTDNYAGNLEYISTRKLGEMTGPLSTSRSVIQLDAETLEPVEEFRSARAAGRQNFMSYQTVLDNCKGKSNVAAGSYKFMFVEDYERRIQ